jgi:MSHA biogenesis protein MshJ
MKQYWQKLAAKIDARNERERGLIFVMVLVVVASLINAVLLDPVLARKKRLAKEQLEQQDQLQTLRSQIQAIGSTGRSDPDAPTRVRLAALEQKLAQTAVALQNTQESLVPPDKMAHLLEDVLTQNQNLKLVSLKTLRVSDLLDTPEPKPVAGAKTEQAAKLTAPAIYKHGVEITVAGSYGDLTQYLESLEKLPWRMFWGKAEMRVEQYPRVVLTITLYTLSMDTTWMAI